MSLAAATAPGRTAPLRLARLRRLEPARVALAVLALLAAMTGVATAHDLMAGAPRTGLLVTGSGRVLLLAPGSAAAASGLRPGDTVTAVDGNTVSGLTLGSALAQAGSDPVWLTEGTQGRHLLFQLRAAPPSTPQLAADTAALVAALVLWLSGLVVGWPRQRTAAARHYAAAALLLALALCALVARDSTVVWAWLMLAPAALGGLAALLLANLTLIRPVSRRLVAGVAAVAGLPALLALLGFVVALPGAVTSLVVAILAVLALATMALPLATHVYAPTEPLRRTLRVALLAAVAGLLPLCAWPGVAIVLTLAGRESGATPGYGISPLWCALALAPLALLYSMLFLSTDTRRLDVRARTGASYVATFAPLGAILVAAVPRLSGPGWVAAVVIAMLLFPPLQRAVEHALAYAVRQPRADYAGALRVVETVTATAAAPVDLASAVARELPALLATRTVTLLLRGLDCPPDAYHLVDASGCTDTILDLDPSLVAGSIAGAGPYRVPAPVPAQLHDLGAALWVPLWWDEAQRGVLVLGPRVDADAYRDEDLEGIGGLARLLALGFHTQQLVAHLRERTDTLVALNHRLSEAHEQERAHLSRELHDVVAQELIALTRQLRRYGNGASPPPPIWADMLAAAQDALSATRRICNGLRPAILDLGLAPALRDLVAAAAERAEGPEVSLSIEGAEQRLAGEVEFALFRVAQEGLNNALNHSGARQVRVEALFNGGVRLRVRDDGRGFAVPRRFEDLPGDHLGLIGMRERLAQLGGSLVISSQPGRGTVLEASAGPGERVPSHGPLGHGLSVDRPRGNGTSGNQPSGR